MNNEKVDLLVQALILKALEENPQGLTDRQIHKIVKGKLKKIKKIVKLVDNVL